MTFVWTKAMSQKVRPAHIREAYDAIALDFAALFATVTFPITEEGFSAAYVAARTEAMHYVGIDLPKKPAPPDSTRGLLTTAAAYMTLPSTVSYDAAEFGIWLSLFLFATQPTSHPTTVRVPITPQSLSLVKRDAAAGAYSPETCRALQALLTNDGFHLQMRPQDQMVALAAIIDAHAAVLPNRPLLEKAANLVHEQRTGAAELDAEIAASMQDYEALSAGILTPAR